MTTESTRKWLSDGAVRTQPDMMEAGSGWSRDLGAFPIHQSWRCFREERIPKRLRWPPDRDLQGV